MKRIALILFVAGFVSVGVGIAIPLVDSVLNPSHVIRCSGYVAYPSGESKPAESNSKTYVDTKSFIPIISGVGLLSIGFLFEKVQKGK